MQIKKIRLIILSCLLGLCASLFAKKPRLTVIIVVDQLAWGYLPKLQQFFTGGFRFLLDNGFNYTDAHHPHGMPETAPGHAALNTGAWAKDHGIVGNHWLNTQGVKIAANQDTPEHGAVFKQDGSLYDYGSSGANIMVDGISDSIRLNSTSDAPTHVYSIALKNYASTAMAGKLGKAIWFDTTAHAFTSSIAYFDQLPDWITRYNKRSGLNTIKTVTWKPRYPLYSPAYHFKNIDNYEFTEQPRMVGKTLTINRNSSDQYHDQLQMNPMGNQIVLDIGARVIDQHLKKYNNDSLVLWLGLSSLDFVGHAFGPDCLETIDMVYQVDVQLQKFFRWIFKKLGNEDVLIALTADHGVNHIPELLNARGLPASRVFVQDLIPDLNARIQEQWNIENLIRMPFIPPYLWINHDTFDTLNRSVQQDIFAFIKKELMKIKGIRHVWNYDELSKACYNEHQLEYYFKNQLYPGRSGDIIIQTSPNNELTVYKTGAGHATPYESNTHVPLFVYQKGVFEKQTINNQVWMLQWANSLATILGIPGPSASPFPALPGIASAEQAASKNSK